MAVKFFGMIKELKNISVYLSNGSKKSRSLDDHSEIVSPSLYNNLNSNHTDYDLTDQTARFPNCSTSSSIDSANSSSSLDSNNPKKQQANGSEFSHKESSSSSQISSGYSTLKSKTELKLMIRKSVLVHLKRDMLNQLTLNFLN